MRVYDPAKSREWKRLAQIHYRAAIIKSGLEWAALKGALSVEVAAFFHCPNRCRQPHSIRKTSRPDCDNLGKAVLDAGNSILWADDAQVSELVVRKWYGYPGQDPFVEVTVRELEG